MIGADSTLACNGRLFDKPPTLDAARKQLHGAARPDARALLLGRGGARRRAAVALERAGAAHHAAVQRRLHRRLSGARRRGRADLGRRLPARGAGRASLHAASTATTSPSSACRCCRCCPSWPATASAWRRRHDARTRPCWPRRAAGPSPAIVGWPVEHSRSPALHGYWLKQHGIDGHYGRLPVEPKPRGAEGAGRLPQDARPTRAAAISPCRTRSTSCRCSTASIPMPSASAR